MNMRIILIMLCFIMACISCAGKDNTAKSGNKDTIDISLKLTQHEQDIEKLKKSVKRVEESENKLDATVSENNRLSIFSSIGVLAFVVILSTIGVIYIRVLTKNINILSKKVESLEKKFTKLEKKDENSQIIKRLNALERQLHQSPKPAGPSKLPNTGETMRQRSSTTASTTIVKEKSTKVGYFDYPMESDNGCFFQEFHENSSDRSKFKATITDDEGEFEPYELVRIRSYSFSPEVLENIDSKVIVADSAGFDVLEKGKVRKEGDKWIIEKPVKVRFK